MALNYGCYETAVLLHLYLQLFYPVSRLRYKHLRFTKQTVVILEFRRRSVACGFARVGLINFIQSGPPHCRRTRIVYKLFNMAAKMSQIYFRYRVWWRNTSKTVEIYTQTKFRQAILIHGWNIRLLLHTLSEKKQQPYRRNLQRKNHFRLRFLPLPSAACDFVSAHRITFKLDHQVGVTTSHRFLIFKLAATASQIYFRFQI